MTVIVSSGKGMTAWEALRPVRSEKCSMRLVMRFAMRFVQGFDRDVTVHYHCELDHDRHLYYGIGEWRKSECFAAEWSPSIDSPRR